MPKQKPTKLSDHFFLYEFVASPTAEKNNIANIPEPEHIKNMMALCGIILEPARDVLQDSIRITSGYRSVEYNAFIGGAGTSQHCKGEAVDCVSSDNSKLFFAIVNSAKTYDQLIWEFGDDYAPSWVHVSYKIDGDNRHQTLKAIKEDGKTKYLPFYDEV